MVINCWLLIIFNIGKCILMFLNKDIFFFFKFKKGKIIMCIYLFFLLKIYI